MLVCVFILCTCFITYISRLDWEKAAKEVIQALTARACTGICWDETGSVSQPALSSSALEQNPALPRHPCIQLPPAQALSALRVSPCTLFGDTKLRADGVTGATSALSIT